MGRLRTAFVVVALLGGAMAVAPATADTTATVVSLSCQQTLSGVNQAASGSVSLTVATATSIKTGNNLNTTVSASPIVLPTSSNGQSATTISNLALRFPVPAGTTFVSASASGGANIGAGTPTATLVGSNVQLLVPGPMTAGATVTLPTLKVTVKVTAASGSTVQWLLAGTGFADGGYSYTANVTGGASAVSCFPSPSPVLNSSAVVAAAVVPDAPIIGVATGGNAQATLHWTIPLNDGGSSIQGYVVTPYIAGVAQPTKAILTTSSSATVTGLTNGTTYTFALAAFNGVGTGPKSDQSNAVTPNVVLTVPGAPTIGTAVKGDASATVNWSAPGNSGGTSITGYVVTPYVGSTAQPATTFNSTATSQVVTGLTNGTSYTFKVAAINSVGTGAQSAASNAVVPVVPLNAPTIGPAVAGNGQATVSWTAPTQLGGATLSGYVVTPYIAGVPQTAVTYFSTATHEDVVNLTNGTAYTFRVAAYTNVTGPQSDFSNEVTPVAQLTAPMAPTIGTATPAAGGAVLTWTAPSNNGGSPVTGYMVTPYIGAVAQPTQTFNSVATTQTVTGLTNGTSYTFVVAAINAIGTGPNSAASNAVVPANPPDAPTIGTASPGNASATVAWTAPGSDGGSAITGYVVTPYIGAGAQPSQTFNSTATSQVVTGLSNGATYTFRVAAINSIGTGAQSLDSNPVVPATVPDPPTIGTATPGNASATVAWTAPVNSGGSPVTGYVVTPYIGATAQTPQAFASTATNQLVTGLTNGTAYTFTVAATNAVGTGAASAASNVVTPATVPGAPSITGATPGNTVVQLAWSAPASDGGSAITGYVVTPSVNGVAQPSQTFASTATTETVVGLSNSVTYTFQVAAINGVGTGANSASSAGVTPVGPIVVPGAPTIGTATATSGSVVRLTWTAPGDNGGSPITGYVVTPYIGATAQAARTFASAATSQSITGLTAGTTYTFVVAASNTAGTGAASAASNAVTPPKAPGAPTIGSATASGASAVLTWTAPASDGGSPIIGYKVTPFIGTTAQTVRVFASTATTQAVLSLTPGTTYTFKVQAYGIGGTGAASALSNAVTPYTGVPYAPKIGTVTPGDSKVVLTWTAPISNGGSTITGYKVTPYVAGVAQPVKNFAGSSTSHNIVGLTNGVTYTFTVDAINVVGTGPESGQSVPAKPTGLPTAPTAVVATPGTGQVSLSWTAPSNNGGFPITAYVVTPYVGTSAQPTQTFNSAATSQVITGLANATTFTFKVAAVTSLGTGPQSAASNAVTPAGLPGQPVIGQAVSGPASATLSWTAPASNGGSAITGYVVTPYLGTTAQTVRTFNSTATTQVITGLTNGSTYTFTVAAKNPVGTGPASVKSNPVIPLAPPNAPTITSAVPGDGVVNLAWNAPASNGGSAITGYIVTSYIGGVLDQTRNFPTTATNQAFVGLVNGNQYTFKVAAVNAIGTGPQSAASAIAQPVGAPTVPWAPKIGKAIPGDTVATLSWSAPTYNGNSAITGYTVTIYVGAASAGTRVFTGTSTSHHIVGLSNGTTYTFTVKATNALGTGPESAKSNAVIMGGPPPPPTNVVATGWDSRADLTWTAPAADGGSPVTGYVVTPYIGSTAQTAVTFNSTATAQTITGLTNGKLYTFKVAAVSAAGTGVQSVASNAVTPGTVPEAPVIIFATAGYASVTLTWTTPNNNSGAPLTGATVIPYIGGVAQTPVVFDTFANQETITGLTNGTAYTFAVSASNSFGQGFLSAQSAPVTPDGSAIQCTISGNDVSDAMVTENNPSNNDGSDNHMDLYESSPDRQYSFLKFNIQPGVTQCQEGYTLPAGRTVSGASIRLYTYNVAGLPPCQFNYCWHVLEKATAPWSENAINWANMPATQTGTTLFQHGTSWFDWSAHYQNVTGSALTADISNYYKTPSINYGWAIKRACGSYGKNCGFDQLPGFQMRTKESGDNSQMPQLVFTLK